MKFILPFFLLLWVVAGKTQPTKRDILEKKIKSIASVYYDETGKKEYSQKSFLSVKGHDSLEYFNDELAFTFIPETDNAGRLKQLTRMDAKNRMDEIHLYKYKNDGSYTIEIIAQGAGTISFSEYDKEGNCFSEIFSGTDTVFYSYSPLGKMIGVRTVQSGLLIDLARTEFDSSGYPAVTHVFGDAPAIIRYRNNSLGLPEEIKQYAKTASGERLESSVIFRYEYY